MTIAATQALMRLQKLTAVLLQHDQKMSTLRIIFAYGMEI